MAFLYRQPKSPYWWIRYKEASGQVKRESTKHRIGIGMETAKARRLCAEKTLQEAQLSPGRGRDLFSAWVLPFLNQTYANAPKTLTKYRSCWNAIEVFLSKKGIDRPAQVARDHAIAFLEWRQNPDVEGVREVCRNSALLDLRIFRLIMNEALRRHLVSENPIAKLNLKADTPKEKPEMSDEDIAKIRMLLKDKPEWMRISFEIAIHQGCRFSETCFPLEDVNLKRREVTLTIKGGRRHRTALHPALVPLLTKLLREGRERTFEMPGNASRDWSRFFRRKRHKLGNLTFHSTRVTVISRLVRGNVTEQKAMRFIGHSNAEVHRIYQRVKVADVADCVNAVDIPTPS